jgi:hypothetical protein
MGKGASFVNRILDSSFFKDALVQGEAMVAKDKLGLLRLI